MPLYFSSEQVLRSFERLASRKSNGKTPLERTSALMYFFAFDATLRKTGKTLLDLNPKTNDGKENRKSIELEFARLVLLEKTSDFIMQVAELGKATTGGKSPEKRISSNFLTVPLKKASEQSKAYTYPNRPSAPLIKMGLTATGCNWGMTKYESWSDNLPKLLTEIKEPTVFTDLAIFIMRDNVLNVSSQDSYMDALAPLIKQRFTEDLCTFWVERIKKEHVFAKHINAPYSVRHEKLSKKINTIGKDNNSIDKYLEHIEYLQNLLSENSIEYTILKQEK